MKVNPELIKAARAALAVHLVEDEEGLDKAGFVPAAAVKASQGAMPPGAPGAPMPPAGPTPPAPPPPPGAPMGAAAAGTPMPMDPSMGGMPPDPSMGGGAPMPPEGGAGQPIQVNLEDLVMLFQQIAQESAAAPSEEDMAGPNEGSEPATTNKQIGSRIDALDEKLDMLLSALGMGGEGAPAGPAGGEEIPPDLAAAMGGGAVPPDAAMGGAPMDAMGSSLPPEAVAGAQAPTLPAGMPVMAADKDVGIKKKASVMAISALAAKLKK